MRAVAKSGCWRSDQPRHDHRDDEVAAAVARRPEQTIKTDVAQRAEHGRHMPVRQGAAHHNRLLLAGAAVPPLSSVRRPSTISVGQWDRFAMVRFLILPPSRIALPQQDGGRRVPVRDGFDIHGAIMPCPSQ